MAMEKSDLLSSLIGKFGKFAGNLEGFTALISQIGTDLQKTHISEKIDDMLTLVEGQITQASKNQSAQILKMIAQSQEYGMKNAENSQKYRQKLAQRNAQQLVTLANRSYKHRMDLDNRVAKTELTLSNRFAQQQQKRENQHQEYRQKRQQLMLDKQGIIQRNIAARVQALDIARIQHARSLQERRQSQGLKREQFLFELQKTYQEQHQSHRQKMQQLVFGKRMQQQIEEQRARNAMQQRLFNLYGIANQQVTKKRLQHINDTRANEAGGLVKDVYYGQKKVDQLSQTRASQQDKLGQTLGQKQDAQAALAAAMAAVPKGEDAQKNPEVIAAKALVEKLTTLQATLRNDISVTQAALDASKQQLQNDKKQLAKRDSKTGDEKTDKIAKQLQLSQKNAARNQKLLQNAQKAGEKGNAARQRTAKAKQAAGDIMDSNKTLGQRMAALKAATAFEEGQDGALHSNIGAVAGQLAESIMAKLDGAMQDIAGKQSIVDTNMQGSNQKKDIFGSYYGKIGNKIKNVIGVSPFVKQSDMYQNLATLSDQNISFNLATRAFLQTVKDKIARTFDATDGTLRRLIRIQQEDTTATRLGMQSALTSFLNEMYETSEYMREVADSIRGSLEEAMALYTADSAISFQYQVNKWLGSLYSVGMSNAGVSAIGTAIGQIAAGDISGLGQGAANLVVMGANRAGLSIGDLLTVGLGNDKQTNDLLQSIVTYLAQIQSESSDSLVVQQEIAKVYGLKASDLRAAASLTKDNTLDKIYGNYLGRDQALEQLKTMFNSMGKRTSTSEAFTNLGSNLQYTISQGIASNPILYSMYKIAPMLRDMTGGIALPFLNVYGFGVDLNTTVADLMSVAALSGGLLSGIGGMLSGLVQLVTGPAIMASGLGFDLYGSNTVTRGSGNGAKTSGKSTSQSGMVGNAAGDDVKEKTLSDAENDSDSQQANAKQQNTEATTADVNQNVIKIYELLLEVTNGGSAFHVKMDDYGLTGFN